MHLTELVNVVSSNTKTDGVSRENIKRVLDATFEEIGKCLATGDAVNITGFGKFSISHREAGEVKAFGKTKWSEAHNRVVFKAGKTLDETVN